VDGSGHWVHGEGTVTLDPGNANTLDVTLLVSTTWALQNREAYSITTPTPFIQVGFVYAAAYLINRAVMTTGNVGTIYSEWLEAMTRDELHEHA
jgi:hypothetical protein